MDFKNKVKVVLYNGIVFLLIILFIILSSKYLYTPIFNDEGIEYIYSRVLFIKKAINVVSVIFLVYIIIKLLYSANKFLFILIFMILIILYYFNIWIYN